MDHTSCECGKRGYLSRGCAKRAHQQSGARLRFYRCPVSNSWHATNDEKNQRRRRKARLTPSRRWRAMVADPHRNVA